MNKSKKNFIYQSIYQVLLIVVPFITAPYMSRVLGADGVGIYSYSASIVSYFALFLKLGINTYGNREVAKVRDDKKKLSEFSCNLFFLHFLIGIIVLVVYVLYIVFFVRENKIIFCIQALTLLSSLLDINWFFFGLEEFKLTVTRNIIVKVLSVCAIFIFVNTRQDVWVYTFIMCFGTLAGQLALWTKIRKHIRLVRPDIRVAIQNLRPMLILFIPTVAISVYKQMDKVMLGVLSAYSEVGIYEYAEKIINAPLGLITALGTVMLPSMTNLYARGNKKEALTFIDSSMEFIMFMAIGCCAGLCAISKDFIPMFLGEEFIDSTYVTYLLAFSIPAVAWANVIRTQHLLPNNQDRPFIISIILGAVVNLVINLILIPKIGAKGAAVGTLVTEVVVCLFQTIWSAEELNIVKYLQKCIKFIIGAFIMYIGVKLVANGIDNIYFAVILELIIGVLLYLVLNFKYCLKILIKKK